MSGKSIDIKQLTIGYREKKRTRVVAEQVTASIFSGELTCLIGANGVGKSTLLRTLSAFQPKLAGNIFIQGKEIGEYSDKELSQVIGVVLTEKIDVRDMTVRDLVAMGRSPYTGFWGQLTQEDDQRVSEAIALVGIENLADRPIQALSDGEKQKMMIAKALAQQTPIIFLDEPTAFLDYPSKVEIMQLLRRLALETRKAIFLSTHDLELALQLSDRLWLMNKQGIEVGTTEVLSEKGSLSTFFPNRSIVFDKELKLYRIAE